MQLQSIVIQECNSSCKFYVISLPQNQYFPLKPYFGIVTSLTDQYFLSRTRSITALIRIQERHKQLYMQQFNNRELLG